jgi:long-chain acyl-CoA synthetase
LESPRPDAPDHASGPDHGSGPDLPAAPAFEALPLFGLLDQAARRCPDRPALVFRNYRLSYARLAELAETMAFNLRRLGFQPGDRAALMLPNCPQMILAYWAVLKAGGVVVMTNPLYMETELVHQLSDSGARLLLTLDLAWPKLARIRERIPVETFVVSRMSDGLRFPLNLLYDFKARHEGSARPVPYDGERVLPFGPLLSGRGRYCHREVNPTRDLALLQYTGGSTGLPKGCELTHANMAVNAQQCAQMLDTLAKDREVFLGVLPYFHIYGLTVCLNLPTLLGATVIPVPRFVPRDLLMAASKARPTVFPGAPSVYLAMLQQKDIARFDLSSIRFCVSGSAPMPVEQLMRFEEATGGLILEGYGLTEASPVTHINPPRGPRKVGSIGPPLPGTQCRIVDQETGERELPVGEVGELVLRGPQVMRGYRGQPGESAAALRGGWLFTGDLARRDEEGYYYLVDRKKDLVISGGYNIYPREIDEVLHAHPRIKEAVSVGIPHPARGEAIKAFVVLKEGEAMAKSEVMAWCRERLANYKIPREVEFRTELPKTAVGKVLRRVLREEEARAAKKDRS